MSRHVDITPFVAELQIYINHLKGRYGDCTVAKTLETVIEQIGELPTADVIPAVHAHFVPTEYDGYADGNPVWDTWECSACHEEFRNEGEEPDFCYCPYCGAIMDEQENKE